MMIETQRLILREMSQADLPDLKAMLQNPKVMYAYEHDFTDKDAQEWLDRQRRRYYTDGFGLWAMVLKETGEMIGQAGLSLQAYQEDQVLEIGYLLKENAWHHGYAREAAEACKGYAFEVLQQDQVCSIIHPDNHASIKVAESIGMTKLAEFISSYYNGDQLQYLYGINRPL
ncbi:GNAT family N-acetyltransferase [Enterococcus alishanensis]